MPAHVEYDIATTDLSTKGKNNVLLKPTIEQHVPRQDVREGVLPSRRDRAHYCET
jgi:hypothetical protein